MRMIKFFKRILGMLSLSEAMFSLSEAMLEGKRIADANGIKHIKRNMFDYDDEGYINGACALGMVKIGLAGKVSNKVLNKQDLPNSVFDFSECLGITVQDFIIRENDSFGKSIEEIACSLEDCGL